MTTAAQIEQALYVTFKKLDESIDRINARITLDVITISLLTQALERLLQRNITLDARCDYFEECFASQSDKIGPLEEKVKALEAQVAALEARTGSGTFAKYFAAGPFLEGRK